ncbi:MAG TPA: hypothetical protein DD624_01100 [Alphaproteobacteria bacterium]|nr:hypothetical protein [Alphaproteobacteria bacterium]
MSESVTFPTLILSPQAVQANVVVIPHAPELLLELPFATVLPAVVSPAENPTEPPVLTLTLPTAETVEIPVNLPLIAEKMPLTVKVMPPETKGTAALKLIFKTEPKPVSKPAEPIEQAVVRAPFTPLKTEAAVMRTIPEQITALFPDLTSVQAPDIPAGTRLEIEIAPEQNAVPAFAKQHAPAASSAILTPAAPLPRKAESETVKIIELPKDAPAAQPFSAPTKPAFPMPAPLPVETVAEPLPPAPQTVAAYETADEISPAVLEKNVFFAKTKTVSVHLDPADAKPAAAPAKQLSPQPSAAPKSTVSLKPQTVLKAVVVNPFPDAKSVLLTEAGVIVPTETVALPPLTPVAVKIVDVIPPSVEQPAEKTVWTVLSEAAETLSKTDAAAFENFKSVLPSISPKLPALMLSYVKAAAKNVPLETWLGEQNVDAIRKTDGGEILLKRLEREFTPKKAADRQETPWKGFDIPFLTGTAVEPVSLYLQRPPEDLDRRASMQKAGGGVRFVVDLTLSRLGRIQLEGLAHRQNRTFSLVIRTQNALPDGAEARIKSLFTQTLGALSYAGGVQVRQTDDFIDFAPVEQTKTGVWA